jgi:hypothetical protein
VHIVRETSTKYYGTSDAGGVDNDPIRYLIDCRDNTNGYRILQDDLGPGAYKGELEVANTVSDAYARGGNNDGATAERRAWESSNVGKVQLTTLTYDDNAYPDSRIMLNCSRGIGQPAVPGLEVMTPTPASPMGNTVQDLFLGCDGSAAHINIGDIFLGWFFHTDAMQQPDLYKYMLKIMAAKRLPDGDIGGIGGVIPDHVFDVKSAMAVGADAAPSTWTSIGGVGGKTMSKQGTVDVVDVETVFGSRG